MAAGTKVAHCDPSNVRFWIIADQGCHLADNPTASKPVNPASILASGSDRPRLPNRLLHFLKIAREVGMGRQKATWRSCDAAVRL
jgi:hypothetical protein